jgi:hypothetical protein
VLPKGAASYQERSRCPPHLLVFFTLHRGLSQPSRYLMKEERMKVLATLAAVAHCGCCLGTYGGNCLGGAT